MCSIIFDRIYVERRAYCVSLISPLSLQRILSSSKPWSLENHAISWGVGEIRKALKLLNILRYFHTDDFYSCETYDAPVLRIHFQVFLWSRHTCSYSSQIFSICLFPPYSAAEEKTKIFIYCSSFITDPEAPFNRSSRRRKDERTMKIQFWCTIWIK